MIIYNYDSETKEYTYSCDASLDPQETINQGKDIYLIPDNATDVKPPTAQVNEVVIYNDGWKIEADFRGQYIVNEDMNPVIVEKIGELLEGYIVISKQEAQTIIEDDLYYIISDGHLIVNPNYEEDKATREKERISHLQCTKRVFVLMLEQLGFDYFEQIEPLINANRQAKLEWELCIELERANPLLDLMGAQLNVSPEQIDKLFQYANGEITEQEFMG